MKKRVRWVLVLSLLMIAGCLGPLGEVTQDQPLGPNYDPNQVAVIVEAAESIGIAAQSIGSLTGNTAVLGFGIVAVALAAIIGSAVKKNGGK